MKLREIIYIAPIALLLAGCGDFGHGKDDLVAACKSYDKAACEANTLCQWASAGCKAK